MEARKTSGKATPAEKLVLDFLAKQTNAICDWPTGVLKSRRVLHKLIDTGMVQEITPRSGCGFVYYTITTEGRAAVTEPSHD